MAEKTEQKPRTPDYSMGAILHWPVGNHVKVTMLEMLRRPGRRTADDIGLSTRQSPEAISQALRLLEGEGLIVVHLPGKRTPQKRYEVTPGHAIRHALQAYEGPGELGRQRQIVARVDGSGWELEDAVSVLETLAKAGITSVQRINDWLRPPAEVEDTDEETVADPDATETQDEKPVGAFSAAEARKAKLARLHESEAIEPEEEDDR